MKDILNKFKFTKTDASQISVPIDKEIYGVKIRRLPNGAYIKALNTVQNLPEILLEACFPGMPADDILAELQSLNSEKLLIMAGRLIQVIPEQFLKIVSELLDIPFEILMDKLTPAETLIILEEYLNANDLTSFFESMKRMVMGNKTVQTILKQD
jgi:hypothetical protein